MSIILQPGDTYVAKHAVAVFLCRMRGANWLVAFTMTNGNVLISLENSWRIIDRTDFWKAVTPL